MYREVSGDNSTLEILAVTYSRSNVRLMRERFPKNLEKLSTLIIGDSDLQATVERDEMDVELVIGSV